MYDSIRDLIYLTSVTMSSYEQEDGDIEYGLKLFFLDKENFFAGHIIYVLVKNNDINEISLME